jgi:hypothetical protein
MPAGQVTHGCCDRCSGAGTTIRARASLGDNYSDIGVDPANAAVLARRRLLKAAIFPPRAGAPSESTQPGLTLSLPPADPPRTDHAHPTFAETDDLPRAVSGTIVDVSPQVLVLGDETDEQRFTLTPDAVAWRGGSLDPAALHQGDHVVVRLNPSSPHTIDRIWADIGRVTGIITERSGGTLVVDEGATRSPQVVTIQPRMLGRIQVRFPNLEPGYLVDIIGLRRGNELDGIVPATPQPGYPASRIPPPQLPTGHVPDVISGSATWHEPGEEPPGVLGICYPALDPETGCAEDAIAGRSHGFARMPYLALGSVLQVRNECSKLECSLPVTGCAPVARLFNDRCVMCGPSPRGRVADLTMASFVALGGELDRGCFNATITIGE